MALKKICRKGDGWSGTCYHPEHSSPISVTGELINGSSDTTDNNLGISRDGDTVQATCGHTDTVIASGKLKVNSKKVVRVDDRTTGSILDGSMVSGSSTTQSI